jgi:hypothetical protein
MLLATLLALSFSTPFNDVPAYKLLGGGSVGTRGVPQLVVVGAPIVGRSVVYRIENGRPGAIAFAGFSLGTQLLPLPAFGATLRVAEPLLALTPTVLDANGTSPALIAAASVPPELSGQSMTGQGIVFDPAAMGGLAFTSARRTRFGLEPRRGLFAQPIVDGAVDWSGLSGADVNGDGRRDVLFGAPTGMGVALVDGSGTLDDWTLLPLTSRSNARALDDFDGDGALDIAAIVTGGQVAILMGNGDGTFGAPTYQRAGAIVSDVASGDFDGDGNVDLVTANNTLKTVALLLGNGDGTFGLPLAISVPQTPTRVSTRDVDGDGALDVLVISSSPEGYAIMQGRGDGSFEFPVFHATSITPTRLFVTDVDGDGLADALATFSGNTLLLRRGTAGGSFGAEEAVTISVSLTVHELVDVTGDGELDLVGMVASSGANPPALLGVCAGNGDATFDPALLANLHPSPSALATTDLDDDGDLDVVVSHLDAVQPVTTLVRGIGVGTYDFPAPYPQTEIPGDPLIADFDGDDLGDVLYAKSNPSEFVMRRSDAFGALGQAETVLSNVAAWDVLTLDVDGDGARDITASNSFNDSILIAYGDGDGGFAAPLAIPAGLLPQEMEIVDVNGDGRLDLLVHDDQGNAVLTFLATGARTYAAALSTPVPSSFRLFVAADVDGDAKIDLVQVHDSPHRIDVLPGLGNGTFAAASTQSGPDSVSGLVGADLDADGDFDLVLSSPLGTHVLLGDGSGDFQSQTVLPLSRTRHVPQIIDVDRDGHLDLVAIGGDGVGSNPWGWTWVARGDGTGAFDDIQRYSAGKEPRALAVGDLDGDTFPDVVSVSTETESLSVDLDRTLP